ncbi:MAG: response regulator transcription factor [Sphingomonas sp.]|nr:response regulator transcription factor [Sphingomonas sp.]
MRLLIVEDDDALATALAAALARRGFASDHAMRCDDARQMLDVGQYGAVLLDLGLPDGDSMALLRQLRAMRNPIPIIVITARDAIGDRINGLNAGADDYVVKPFDIDELTARLAAVLRRQGGFTGSTLELGNLSLDTHSGDLSVNGGLIVLSARERQLIGLLLRRAGQVVSKSLAEDQLFGLSDPVGSNAVEVYVHRLRRKLQGAGSLPQVETIRGVGYLLRMPK